MESMNERRPVRYRRLPKPAPGVLEKWVLWGFVVLIPLLPLMLGTTTSRPYPMLIARVIILGLSTLFVMDALINQKRTNITGLWVVLFAGALFTLLQVTPLPPWLLSVFSPETDRLYHVTLDGLGLYGQGQWRTLSLDPAETWFGLSGFFSLLMVYLIAANLFNNDERLNPVLKTIAITGFALAMIGFIQKALGISKIYGLIPFEQQPPFFFSTFINANHLAAFLGMSVPIQIGFALKEEGRQRRLFILAMAVVTSTAVFMTLSKGGIIAFLAGQLLFTYLLWRRSRGKKELLWVQVAVALVIVLSSWLALQQLADEFSSDDQAASTRPEIWQDAWQMAKTFPVAGIGAESFKVAYPIYKTVKDDLRYDYPENILLQIVVESGFPVGAAIIFGFAFGLFLIFKTRHLKRMEMAGLCAIFVAAIHNYVDFNLSTFAVAMPLVFLIGALTTRAAQRSKNSWIKPRKLPRWVLISVWIMAVVTVLAGEALWLHHRIAQSQQRLHRAVYDRSLSESQFERVLSAEVGRHPTDAYLRILASERYRAGSFAEMPNKMLHLEKAGLLSPTDPMVDRWSGKAYALVGDFDNARAAFASAQNKTLEQKPLDDTWSQMLKSGLQPKDLAATVPKDNGRIPQLARFLVDREESDTAKMLLSNWVDTNTEHAPATLYLMGKIHLEEGGIDAASETAGRLIAKFPANYQGYMLKGEIAQTQRSFDEALNWYAKAETLQPVNIGLWLLQGRTYLAAKRYDEANQMAVKIHGLAWRHPSRKLEAYLLSGDIDMARSKYDLARGEYNRALVYSPKNPGIHERIAKTYEKQGNTRAALRYYSRAQRYDSTNPELKSIIERLGESVRIENERKTQK